MNPPEGYPRISLYLNYEDAGAMIRWLEAAFGMAERHSMRGEYDAVMHAEMALENRVVMMGSLGVAFQNPEHLGQVTQSLYVYVDDLDAHCAPARAAGAEIIEAPAQTPYGDRRYGVCDPEGHHLLRVPVGVGHRIRMICATRIRNRPPETKSQKVVMPQSRSLPGPAAPG